MAVQFARARYISGGSGGSAVRSAAYNAREQTALRAADSRRHMELPGVGREHQAALNELAQRFSAGRTAVTLSGDWERRVVREAEQPKGSS